MARLSVFAVSLATFRLLRFTPGNQVVTWWRIKAAHVRRVTIGADKVAVFVQGFQLVADILPQPILVVTLGAGSYWHIRFQAAKRCCLRNVDVAGRTFGYVLLAIVAELDRYSFRNIVSLHGALCELVAASAVDVDWLLGFPVATEASSMVGRGRLEARSRGNEVINPTGFGRHRRSHSHRVTDGAVVISLGFVIRVMSQQAKRRVE